MDQAKSGRSSTVVCVVMLLMAALANWWRAISDGVRWFAIVPNFHANRAISSP